MDKRIVISGGVLTPALAVIDELKKRGGWNIYYLGRKYVMEGEKAVSAESTIVPGEGAKFIPFNPGRFQRRFTRHTIPSLLRVPLGFLQALYLLNKIKPQVILSFGSYVSVPVVLVGWLLRVPILTHEQTVVFGLASKINALFARKIAVSFFQSLGCFSKDKVILTGNPIRKEIFESKKSSQFSITNYQLPIIYITGGNQGSHVINMALLETLPQLLEKYVVIHQTGEKDYSQITNHKSQITKNLQAHYFLTPFVGSEDIGWVLNNACLVVSRAGANTVCELAALGKPAIFIPIPWTYMDEQTKNAKLLVEAGVAEILPQEELSGNTLFKAINSMIGNLEKYQKNSDESKKLVISHASAKLVDELQKMI
ncbi:MAG: UDP-N-acetylglucosamine--N-acetylmuramyl-(pentapeptide) pyrophosphoryl-undecaprenol N-acetylglucosamine transferase [bacterium]|nr:UDP-N-acetylglucosamine--N-acetylmuramyl-(pentapeptide) pyrophosphoryl-undecaprenol N-acetylglucosamine transferase [bacterium]